MNSFLEDHFPHIAPQLARCWDKPEEFRALIAGLIFDTRGGRAGLPEEAWEELYFLETLHKLAFPSDLESSKEEEQLDDDIKWVS